MNAATSAFRQRDLCIYVGVPYVAQQSEGSYIGLPTPRVGPHSAIKTLIVSFTFLLSRMRRRIVTVMKFLAAVLEEMMSPAMSKDGVWASGLTRSASSSRSHGLEYLLIEMSRHRYIYGYIDS